jgi:hypothetical protein
VRVSFPSRQVIPALFLALLCVGAAGCGGDHTCGTQLNPDCGLTHVLRWLTVAAVVLGAVLTVLVLTVIRYCCKSRSAPVVDDDIDVE